MSLNIYDSDLSSQATTTGTKAASGKRKGGKGTKVSLDAFLGVNTSAPPPVPEYKVTRDYPRSQPAFQQDQTWQQVELQQHLLQMQEQYEQLEQQRQQVQDNQQRPAGGYVAMPQTGYPPGVQSTGFDAGARDWNGSQSQHQQQHQPAIPSRLQQGPPLYGSQWISGGVAGLRGPPAPPQLSEFPALDAEPETPSGQKAAVPELMDTEYADGLNAFKLGE